MKNKNFFFIFIALTILIITPTQLAGMYYESESIPNIVKTINSVAESEPILAKTTPRSLVLIDVDETITVSQSIHGRLSFSDDPRREQWAKNLPKEVLEKFNTKPTYYYSILYAQDPSVLIEPRIAQIITSLQNRKVPVYALTSLRTGPHFAIPNFPEWRYNKLKLLGIDFTSDLPDITFAELPADQGSHPLFYRGILCTHTSTKRQVLTAFLDKMKLKPNMVISYDDRLEHLYEEAHEMRNRKISFYGYYYQGAQFLPELPFDPDAATLQFKHLVEKEEWLSDEQALQLLKDKI